MRVNMSLYIYKFIYVCAYVCVAFSTFYVLL